VQGELRMLLGDKLGKRVYTQKNAGEIKKALEKLIADDHPYMQNINDFDISKIIKSLNEIGLASVALAATATATGATASSNEYKQGGNLFQNGGEDPPPKKSFLNSFLPTSSSFDPKVLNKIYQDVKEQEENSIST
jgi:hypothetical protein